MLGGVWDSRVVVKIAEKEEGRMCAQSNKEFDWAEIKSESNGSYAMNIVTVEKLEFDSANTPSVLKDMALDRDSIDPRLLQNNTSPRIMVEDVSIRC